MNITTATPRTDAKIIVIPTYFKLECVGADFARTLETELAAERAIVSRIWVQLGSPTYAELNGRSIYDLIDEIKTDRAEAKQEADHYMSVAQKATDELARLRAELSAVQAQHLHEIDELAAQAKIMNALRAENERLTKQIKDDNRAYGCELRDPNGTIWEQAAKDHARAESAEREAFDWKKIARYETARAERAEAALADHKTALEIANRSADEQMRYKREAEAERDALAKDKARLDWLLQDNVTRFDVSYHDRAAIDAAMVVKPYTSDKIKKPIDSTPTQTII